eukprot:COSAG02_NODE_894_length_16133_cov_5.336036_12_plen_94_part_00
MSQPLFTFPFHLFIYSLIISGWVGSVKSSYGNPQGITNTCTMYRVVPAAGPGHTAIRESVVRARRCFFRSVATDAHKGASCAPVRLASAVPLL